MPRVLHLLSQRPSLTGSGVTLDALVRHAAAAGWEQRAVVGVPAGDAGASVGGLDPAHVHPLLFESTELPFPIPGMSDVMPYPSTRFSAMSTAQLDAYRLAWQRHLEAVVAEFRPHVVHCHHVWILGSLVKEIASTVPVVSHCHATGLRQMELCPHLAPAVRAGCARIDRFVVLHHDHARALAQTLGVETSRLRVVGAGFRDDLFTARDRSDDGPPRLLYTGKYSAAKGLPQLLDAFDRLRLEHPALELHIAGSGAGEEADALGRRMQAMAPAVILHGQLDQPRLAELMRRCAVCVLPSFYEGLPLVLVEALASGCRLVATRLPGIDSELAPHLGPALHLVDMPEMKGVDTPDPRGLPAFVERLRQAVADALALGPIGDPAAELPGALEPFTWAAVFRRVERVWLEVVGSREPS